MFKSFFAAVDLLKTMIWLKQSVYKSDGVASEFKFAKEAPVLSCHFHLQFQSPFGLNLCDPSLFPPPPDFPRPTEYTLFTLYITYPCRAELFTNDVFINLYSIRFCPNETFRSLLLADYHPLLADSRSPLYKIPRCPFR